MSSPRRTAMRLIPSHKKDLIVPPSLEPTHYRFPRLLKDSDSDTTAPPSRDSRSETASRKQVKIMEGLSESAPGTSSIAADTPKPNARSGNRSAFDSPSSSVGPAHTTAHAHAANPPPRNTIGVRNTSPRRRVIGSPPHVWAEELNALMRSRDAVPPMEEFDSTGILTNPDGSRAPWGVYEDGTDVWGTDDPHRNSPRRRTPRYARRKTQTAYEWIMSARQHEVLVHNGVKWKSPSEAYGNMSGPSMYQVDRSAGGRARTPTVRGASRTSPKRPLPSALTGVERLRQLSTENIYEDRREHALFQEKRRRNASYVLAQMRSLSPRRREASPVTKIEKAETFSESARWFGNPGAVLGTPRPQHRDNGVPGPGYYQLPRTFGAGFPELN